MLKQISNSIEDRIDRSTVLREIFKYLKALLLLFDCMIATYMLCFTYYRNFLIIQDFDEATDMAGKPIPGFLCRVLTPETVLLALHDRASQVANSYLKA